MTLRSLATAKAAIVLTAAALGGCIVVDDEGGRGSGSGGFRQTVDYTCEGNREFTASFDGRDARVRAAGETHDLELVRGNRRYREYEGDDGARLTVDDDEAYLRIEDERDFQGCEAD